MDLVSATHRARGRPSLPAAVGSVLLGALAFLVTGALLRAVLPPPPETPLETKLDHLREHRGYDVLFVGSSSVYRHVDPALFDELTAAAGRPTRSYNLGVPAMSGLETLHALRRVLDLDLPELRWVVLDARHPGYMLAGENHLTSRVASWHDLPTTWWAVRLVADAPETVAWKLDQLRRHLTAFAYRTGNVGRLRELLEPRLEGNPQSRAEHDAEAEANRVMERGRAGDGFAPLDWAMGQATALQQRFLYERRMGWEAEADEMLAGVEAARAGGWPLLDYQGEPRAVQELTEAERDLLRTLVATAEQRGVSVVFLNAPDVRQKEFFVRAGLRDGVVPGLLDTDDPELYPALFHRRNRFDRDHLNEAGAALYTRVLAQRFLVHERTAGGRP